jgi:glycerol-3-phosphate O-acyltransferase
MGEISKPKLFDLNRQRRDIVETVVDRVLSGRMKRAWESQEHGLEYVLNEAAYFEMSRLERSTKKRHREQYDFWHDIAIRVGRSAEDENADLLEGLVRRYATDIIGNFNPAVYRVVTSIIPVGLNLLFNAQSVRGALTQFRKLGDEIVVLGHVERIRRLSELGTLVIVPTHASHMDSILVGWALDAVGLPPVTYGAGKNLFAQRLTAFFMRNLGAYKVDRRLRFSLYKEVLKTTSQILLEEGFHSLFFPGGTRSRSGAVEQNLKLGLLGTSLSAYTESLIQGRPRRQFIVPLTINYHLVLEAETLVSEHLRTDGRSRFIIENDEFSELSRVFRFTMNTMKMESALVLRFGEPMDPFGNQVDENGVSHDRQGREIDPARYVETDTGPQHDVERDREYISTLGKRIGEAFVRNTVLFSIHVVALALFEILASRHARWDLYRMIRFGRGELISKEQLLTWCDRLLHLVHEEAAAGRVFLGPPLQTCTASELVEEACGYFTMYHTTPLIHRRGREIELNNLPLLFYYSNRARGYGLELRLQALSAEQ